MVYMTGPLALVIVIAAVSVVLMMAFLVAFVTSRLPEPFSNLHKQQQARIAAFEATLRACRLGFLTNRWFRLPR
jgi:hypothetical protein